MCLKAVTITSTASVRTLQGKENAVNLLEKSDYYVSD
jgi:hypothetical protein